MNKLILISILVFAQLANAISPAISRFNCEAMIEGSKETIPEDKEHDPLEITRNRFDGQVVDFEGALGWVAALLAGKDRENFIWIMGELLDPKDPAKKANIIRRRETGVEKRSRPDLYIHYITREFDTDGDVLNFLFETVRRAFSLNIGDVQQWSQSSANERPNVTTQFHWRAMNVIYFQYKLYCRLLRLAHVDDWEVKSGTYMLTREFNLSIPGKNPVRLISPNERDRILFDQIGLRFTTFRFLRDLEESRLDERQLLVNKDVSDEELAKFDARTDIQLQKAIYSFVEPFVSQIDVYFASRPGLVKKYGGYGLAAVLAAAIGFSFVPLARFVPTLDSLAQNWDAGTTPPRAVGPGFPAPHVTADQVLHQLEEQARAHHNSAAQELARKGLEDLKRLDDSQP